MSVQTVRKVKVDGYEFDAGSDSHIAAVERERGKLTAELDTATKRADAAEARAKVAEAALEQAKADAKNVDIDAMVDARLTLVDQARKILGDGYEHKGKSDREIMADALAKAGTKVAEDASDDFVAGAFSAAASAAGRSDAEPEEGDEDDDEDEEAPPRGDSRDVRITRVRVDEKPAAKPYRMPSLGDKWRR